MPSAANLLLAIAWLFASRASIGYLIDVFTEDAYRLNLYLALAALALVAVRSSTRGASLLSPMTRAPSLRWAPLGLVIGSLALQIFLVAVVDVRLLAAVAAGLGTYGLLGLYLDPVEWKRGLAGAFLLIAALPFGEQASTYLGFTARLATAQAVGGLLSLFGFASVSVNAILQLESAVAYVDVPCSGIKSLWTGAIFFFGATHLDRTRIGPRWLLAGLVFGASLILANLARVSAIVLLASAFRFEKLAALVHEPLGIIGFGIACAIGRFSLSVARSSIGAEPAEVPKPGSSKLAFALTAAALACGLIASRPPIDESSIEVGASLSFPFEREPMAISEQEKRFFGRVGESAAEKFRFRSGALTGSAIVVSTRRWRAHHPPEVCLAAHGIRIDRLEELRFGPEQSARIAQLDHGARTALYWYQSEAHTTGDILERMTHDVFESKKPARWALVSIVLDRSIDASDPELAELYQTLRRGIRP